MGPWRRLSGSQDWFTGTRRLAVFVVALGAMTAAGCRVTDCTLWRPAEPILPDAYAVEVVRDVAYYDGPDFDDHRHRLDLYLPKGKTNCPVVILVHGGFWMFGDNRCCGLYSSVGEFLASQGIAAVVPNYRLSPEAKHPVHIQDVARAFAWTRNHIGDYGGRPDQIVLVGHSAGGHLVSLLATDERYLRAEGQQSADVKGVVTISGVYRIPTESLPLTLGGGSPSSANLDELVPFRGAGGWSLSRRLGLAGIPLDIDIFGCVFGADQATREDASPINHVRPGLPPFLIFSAQYDLPMLPGTACAFHAALREQGCDARLFTVTERNHSSIMYKAIEARDPVARAVVDFVYRHCKDGTP
jgi:acetyl esterase/lipase